MSKTRGDAFSPHYYIEAVSADRARRVFTLRGWAAAETFVHVELFDDKGRRLPAKAERCRRYDVERVYDGLAPLDFGFFVEMPLPEGRRVTLRLCPEVGEDVAISLPLSGAGLKAWRCGRLLKKGLILLKEKGAAAVWTRFLEKVRNHLHKPVSYSRFLSSHLPDEEELSKQRKREFDSPPLFSVVVPLYRTDREFLSAMVESVRSQTYRHWELILSDGSPHPSPLGGWLSDIRGSDERIRVISPGKEPLGISDNTNRAISLAKGDYVAFLDHDDVLCPHALYACAEAILNARGDGRGEADVIYSDEDKMDLKGKTFREPAFKPDFDPDLLYSVNYICHLLVVRRSFLMETGLLRSAYDGAQDYDLILRLSERAGRIIHIPQILYHWRCHQESTSQNPEAKSEAFEAGRRALNAHYERCRIPAQAVMGEFPGLYRTVYHWPHSPLVSILIPNKDQVPVLKRCLMSILEKTEYPSYEILIIENNSTQEETFRFYREMSAADERVHVVTYREAFNYSAINNYGAARASGDYLLLLNNDTEVIDPSWLTELMGYGQRPDVGIVGARLYYPDNRIQHAGVVLGYGGVAGHCFVQQPRESTGYCHRIICAQDYSAVTAACMLVRRSVYEEVGGFFEGLAVAFNDVDFCLKVREKGYLVVYDPHAQLIHYESLSRGLEDTPEKQARFAREIALIRSRWPKAFDAPDPYYNPNLSLETQDFSIRRNDTRKRKK